MKTIEKYKILLLIIILLSGIYLLSTCTKVDRVNPWDEKATLSPDEWAPKNLTIESIDYTSIKLSWDYQDKNIEGFRLDKRKNGGEWQNSFQSFIKTDRSFIDTTIETIEINTYDYRLYAYAGVNKSTIISINYSISIPIVTTTAISNITQTTASSGGNVISDGGGIVTARGVCWSTNQNPKNTDTHTIDGSGIGIFTSSLTDLIANTLYYVRAYATNNIGTSYGSERTFATQLDGTTVTDFDGNVYSTVIIGTQEWMAENLKVTHYRNGEPIPNVTDGAQWGNLLTGAYCWYNNDETTYKNVYGALYNYYTVVDSRNLCPTGWHIPSDAEWTTLTTYLGGESVAGSKMKETGTTHWNSPNTDATNESGFLGLPGGYRYDYGTFNSIGYNGYWWSSTEYATSNAWGRLLNYGNGYVYRGYTNKEDGFSVRCVKDSQEPVMPTVTTTDVTNATQTTVTGGGNITSDGGSNITARGVCWSANQNPTISDSHTTDGIGTGLFTSSLTGLSENTLYNVRAYATNKVGTAYGENISYTTLGPVTDIDGNVYTTVTIGTQVWMVENLKVTHYRNGESIPNITDGTQWISLSTGAYCWYNNDEAAYKDVYGALYNYYTVADSRNLCPTGWHIPSDTEWTTLTTFLGGESLAGGKMKEIGTVHWQSPNAEATNESGFTGLPGGYRNNNVTFDFIGNYGYWWCSTEYNTSYAWGHYLRFNDGGVYIYSYDKECGFSVRCLRD